MDVIMFIIIIIIMQQSLLHIVTLWGENLQVQYCRELLWGGMRDKTVMFRDGSYVYRDLSTN